MGITNFTHPYREWICHDSVDNKRSNNSAALHPIGPNLYVSTKISRARAGWARGQKTVKCQAISAIRQVIGLQIET